MSRPLDDIPNEYPVELTPPDVSPYRDGTHGVPHVHTLEASAPGPHVAISAVVHGNEPVGAIVLDRMLREGVRPARGRLSLAFVNVAAYEAFDPARPNASRWVDEDFNRLWSREILEGERTSVELARARELRPWLDTVDLLLDVHTMQHRTAPLMMAGPADKGLELARAVGAPEIVVRDAGHAAGPRMRDYAGFVDPASPRNALLVECGQHWEAGAEARALDASARFLRATGAVDEGFGEGWPSPDAGPQRTLEITHRVTIATDRFAFAAGYVGLDVIPEAGTVFARDGDEELLTPHDDCVLVMPSKRLWKGQTAVRLGRFVEG